MAPINEQLTKAFEGVLGSSEVLRQSRSVGHHVLSTTLINSAVHF